MNNITVNKAKLLFTALAGALNSWMGILATPVYLLLLLGVLDYFTGLAAAPYRNEPRSSYKGLRGIVKKICILLIVVVAAIVDWMLMYAAETLNITLPVTFFIASLTAVWLICNEIISVLENMGDIGVKLPPFLAKAVVWVKQAAEKKGERHAED